MFTFFLCNVLGRKGCIIAGLAVEIIGKVQNDLSVRVMASTDMGPEGSIGMFTGVCEGLNRGLTRFADFDAVEAVVDATHRYSEIFYSKNG